MKHDATGQILELSREALHSPKAALDELVTASREVENLTRAIAIDLEAKRAARERILSGSGKASALEAALRASDDEIGSLNRMGEIAIATGTALIEKIDSVRTAEEVERRAAEYAAAKNDLTAFVEAAPQRLAELAKQARELMKDYGAVESAVLRANARLPEGAAPLPSIEWFRKRVAPTDTQRAIRTFKGFADGAGRVFGAQGEVQAEQGPDGRWNVTLGREPPYTYVVGQLVDIVEVEAIRHPAGMWAEQLPRSLCIPSWRVGEVDGWSDASDQRAPIFPDRVLARLAALENAEPASPPLPQVARRLVLAARWEAEQTPAASKAA